MRHFAVVLLAFAATALAQNPCLLEPDGVASIIGAEGRAEIDQEFGATARIPCEPGYSSLSVSIDELKNFNTIKGEFDIFWEEDIPVSISNWKWGFCEDGDDEFGTGGDFIVLDSNDIGGSVGKTDGTVTVGEYKNDVSSEGVVNSVDEKIPTGKNYRIAFFTQLLNGATECPPDFADNPIRARFYMWSTDNKGNIEVLLGFIGAFFGVGLLICYYGFIAYTAASSGWADYKKTQAAKAKAAEEEKALVASVMVGRSEKYDASVGRGGGSARRGGSKRSKGSNRNPGTVDESDKMPENFYKPKYTKVSQLNTKTVKKAPHADALVVTANDTDLLAVLEKFFDDGPISVMTVAKTSCYFGVLAKVKCAVISHRPGSVVAQRTTLDALKVLPWIRLVVCTGHIPGMGEEQRGQKLGDIMIADQLVPFESDSISSPPIRAFSAHKAFIDAIVGFREAHPTEDSPVKVSYGPVLSGDKVIKKAKDRDALLDEHPKALGVELEGLGVAAAAIFADTDWVLVKGVSDWCDGRVHPDWRPWVASVTVKFILHAFATLPDM